MMAGYDPVIQALFGSLFTWGVTALGASLVFLFKSENKKLLDGSLGFAGGVMTAASFWSLLSPALEITEQKFGKFAFWPVAIGFTFGAIFVHGAEKLLTFFGFSGFLAYENDVICKKIDTLNSTNQILDKQRQNDDDVNFGKSPNFRNGHCFNNNNSNLKRRNNFKCNSLNDNFKKSDENFGAGDQNHVDNDQHCRVSVANQIEAKKNHVKTTWRRICLLILAITVHNIPEGLAVGVGFGAVGKSASATLESARNLALGIGIQNFPEGFAVSLPLVGLGYSKWRAFWYGQLSGLVEPFAALLGALAVQMMEPLLPYALSFAAGAMIFVVFDDIIPESQINGNGKLASWCAMVGFIVMMSLDVGLA